MGQIKFMTSMTLIGLFIIAIISFGINFATDNSTGISLSDRSTYGDVKTSTEEGISQFYTDANTSTTAIVESTISSQSEATEGGTGFKVGIWTSLGYIKDSTTLAFTEIFGADNDFGIVATSFFALLGIIAGFYIYKTWAGRNPD